MKLTRMLLLCMLCIMAVFSIIPSKVSATSLSDRYQKAEQIKTMFKYRLNYLGFGYEKLFISFNQFSTSPQYAYVYTIPNVPNDPNTVNGYILNAYFVYGTSYSSFVYVNAPSGGLALTMDIGLTPYGTFNVQWTIPGGNYTNQQTVVSTAQPTISPISLSPSTYSGQPITAANLADL